jgi:hypothetical protein
VNLAAAAANAMWAGSGLGARMLYRRALDRPWQTQAVLLERYLRENRQTVFGRAYAFDEILATTGGGVASCEASARRLAAAFQEHVPISTYDDLQPLIARVRGGEPSVLTRAPIVRLVPSSGSTTAAKLVPCTIAGQRELSRAVDAWIGDLFLNKPALMSGTAYWSISPAIPPDRSGAVPVGFDNDSAYLGVVRQALARAVVAVPDTVASVYDGDAFRYVTLLFLLRARDLRLISVWHPTFLTRLLDGLSSWFDRAVRDLADGTVSPPGPIGDSVRQALRRRLGRHVRRAAELERLPTRQPSAIWPQMTTLSCWSDGPAASYARDLHDLFPAAQIQPKGLIATEGIVTIPFGGKHPLAVSSHFFEFLECGGDETNARDARLAHELETDGEYVVLLTTGSGLYRYRLGDKVRVVGRLGRTPSLRFIGKDDRVSDRFGEKLSDGFVAGVIDSLFAQCRPRFAMLAPERTADGIAYTLFVESDAPTAPAVPAALERALRRNPHYAWCVDIGQLLPARVVPVGPNADRAYVDTCVRRGQRLGDVKPVSLHGEGGWESILPAAGHQNAQERAVC